MVPAQTFDKRWKRLALGTDAPSGVEGMPPAVFSPDCMEVVARAVRAALRHAGSSALGEQVVDAMLVEPSQHALPLSGGDGDGVPLFTGRVTSVIAFVRCRVAWVLWVGAVARLWGTH